MARSSSHDPLEKFRYQVTFFAPQTFALTTSLISSNTDNDLMQRSGFSEIVLPKATTKEVVYRENNDGPRPIKTAGLSSYEPLVLRRGVTRNRELYDWYSKVNNDAGSINTFQAALAGANIVPFQEPQYRRDILVSTMDREGVLQKHWFMFNAFPVGYKPGNDLSALDDQKLIEELTITFETFVEVTAATISDAIKQVEAEAKRANRQAAAAAAISVVTGLF